MTAITGIAREIDSTTTGIWSALLETSPTLQDIGIDFTISGGLQQTAAGPRGVNYAAAGAGMLTGTVTALFRASGALSGYAAAYTASGHYSSHLRSYDMTIEQQAFEVGTVAVDGSGLPWRNFIPDGVLGWSLNYECAVDDSTADYTTMLPTLPTGSGASATIKLTDETNDVQYTGTTLIDNMSQTHRDQQLATATFSAMGSGTLQVAGNDIFGVSGSGTPADVPLQVGSSIPVLAFQVADSSSDDSKGALISAPCLWTSITHRVNKLSLIEVTAAFQSSGVVSVSTQGS